MSELSQIFEKISRIESMMESNQKVTEERLTTQRRDLTEIYKDLNGPPSPGMKVTLDRLNETEKARRWLLRAVIVAILGMGTELVWLATHSPKP